MTLQKDLREFIELLNSNRVEYVIVGAYALAFHGWPRDTGDIDIFIRRSADNARRVASALEQFGFASLGMKSDDFETENQVVQLGVAPNRIDILTSLPGCTFDEVWTNHVACELDGLPVKFIGKQEFIKNKRVAGRLRDLADIDALE